MASSVYTQETSQTPEGSRLDELRAEEQELFGEDSTAEPTTDDVTTFGMWDLVRMVVVLGLVVAAIYGVFHLLRKNSAAGASDDELISLLGSRSLSGNRSLHLVEIGRQVFLVGSSERSVELVAEISDQESIDEIRLQAANRPSAGRKSFSDILTGVLGGGRSASIGDSLSFMTKQKERLKRL